MKNYNISGSIVVYNKPEDAVKTVESVIANTGDNFLLYVIDNNRGQNQRYFKGTL